MSEPARLPSEFESAREDDAIDVTEELWNTAEAAVRRLTTVVNIELIQAHSVSRLSPEAAPKQAKSTARR